jgi:hypothetical protein
LRRLGVMGLLQQLIRARFERCIPGCHWRVLPQSRRYLARSCVARSCLLARWFLSSRASRSFTTISRPRLKGDAVAPWSRKAYSSYYSIRSAVEVSAPTTRTAHR